MMTPAKPPARTPSTDQSDVWVDPAPKLIMAMSHANQLDVWSEADTLPMLTAF